VALKERESSFAEAARASLFAEALEKVREEERDILRAFPKGRYADGNDVEAKEEVLPEPAVARLLLNVLVGSNNDPNVHAHRSLAANPLSAAAGYWTIRAIAEQGACEKAGAAGDRLTAGLNRLIDTYELPFVAFNQGSICHLETVATMLMHIDLARFWTVKRTIDEAHRRKRAMEEMGAAYMAEGIVTLAGSRLYTSAADTDEIIDEALDRFERVFRNVEGVRA